LLDKQGPVPESAALTPGAVVILGYGRVGELTGHALRTLSVPFTIVEEDIERARLLADTGHAVIWGDAAAHHVLNEAGVARASIIIVALPDENSTILAVRNIREVAPDVRMIVRARVREELPLLSQLNVHDVVVPEYEGGLELMVQALTHLGYPLEEVEAYRIAVRDIHYDLEH
jgi:CPA2 family monovalent cation:H+ antiporter-2